MACAIRRIGRNLRGYDAAIWNCRFQIAATPQLRFAQLHPSDRPATVGIPLRSSPKGPLGGVRAVPSPPPQAGKRSPDRL